MDKQDLYLSEEEIVKTALRDDDIKIEVTNTDIVIANAATNKAVKMILDEILAVEPELLYLETTRLDVAQKYYVGEIRKALQALKNMVEEK